MDKIDQSEQNNQNKYMWDFVECFCKIIGHIPNGNGKLICSTNCPDCLNCDKSICNEIKIMYIEAKKLFKKLDQKTASQVRNEYIKINDELINMKIIPGYDVYARNCKLEIELEFEHKQKNKLLGGKDLITKQIRQLTLGRDLYMDKLNRLSKYIIEEGQYSSFIDVDAVNANIDKYKDHLYKIGLECECDNNQKNKRSDEINLITKQISQLTMGLNFNMDKFNKFKDMKNQYLSFIDALNTSINGLQNDLNKFY
jgi:hypothetical protein